MMRSRWAVYTETWTVTMGFAALYGLRLEPLRGWSYYRWRWLARLNAALMMSVPIAGMITSARVLGRVTERGRSWRFGHSTTVREI